MDTVNKETDIVKQQKRGKILVGRRQASQSIQQLTLPNLTVVGWIAKAWYTFVLVYIRGTGVPPIRTKLSYFSNLKKTYHAFAFKPVTVKFGKSSNFWMLFQMMCPIFNSIDIEYSYQEKKYVHTHSPAYLEHDQWAI